MFSRKEFIITADGSSSIFLPELNENYHSSHGAIQEAQHVYIKKGLQHILPKKNIKILEIGFGTGLNALLSSIFCRENQIHCEYHSIEKYPLSTIEVKQLNYGHLCNEEELFHNLHQVPWNLPTQIASYFILNKLQFDVLTDHLHDSFDLIYFDAFAPDKQPEMWSEEIFSNLKNCMNPDAVLVTYCCKGSVKRILQSLNFKVEKTDGPIGKREMLRVRLN